MKLHAFVAMPFGVKPDAQGNPIDFNRVYALLIKPALEEAGLEVFRADEEQRAGDIRADMFQELLMADLVLADLSVDNPNVWYELGVRHALRARGVILIQSGRDKQPFDIYTDRKLRYRLKDGKPDPAFLKEDRKLIADMARATLRAWHGRKVSPVYALLPNLEEPDWKRLRSGDAREFWERHDEWSARIERARDEDRPGDVLVLADEAPVTALRVEARLSAGEALRQGQHFDFALEQFDQALAFDPLNAFALRQKGICLQRLGRVSEARDLYRKQLRQDPDDAEAWSLLGRLAKDSWTAAWRLPGSSPEQMRADAAYEDALLRESIECYLTAFRKAPSHFYSGINALTLIHLYQHLKGEDRRFHALAPQVAGGVRWSASSERRLEQRFWAAATLGDLAVLAGDPEDVRQAYKEAIVHATGDWFALDSVQSQLRLLADLGFHPANVQAGMETFERAMRRLRPPEKAWQPQRVFLFSGHMMDAARRRDPRFPPAMEASAAAAIGAALDAQSAGPDDLAITQGAAGGDLLFAEACIARGVRVQAMLPLAEPEFIEVSILASMNGAEWRKRFLALRDHPLCLPPCIMPKALGPLPRDHEGRSAANPFVRCNLWMLYTSLALGVQRTRFICFWNGARGDGPGGTDHMYREVKRRTGQVTWIDSRTLLAALPPAPLAP